jgi:uncharacterized glyoxalase superfamily protein PhnB
MHLQKLSLILKTNNVEDTIRFYEVILGFKSRSNFPDFVSVWKDEVDLMFMRNHKDEEKHRPPVFTGSIYIFMKNIDELWETVKDKATVTTSLADREYGVRDFSILDNNGYELIFGEDTSGAGK